MFEDIDGSMLMLKTFGWIILLIIFMTISYLNADKIDNKSPMYIYAFISWAVLVGMPFIMNTEYGLGEIVSDEVYDDDEMIGISLQRTLPNTIITIIYFGFFVNAIVKKMNKGNTPSRDPLSSRHSSSRQSENIVGSTTGENYKLLAKSLSKQFSTTVYMAIFIVLINVFSTGYIYYFCEDKNDDYFVRSIIMSQYNIVIITVIGIITYIVSNRLNS